MSSCSQAAEDTARLKELQESVLSLTKQVQQLLPWHTKASAAEVERDAAQHKMEQLQVSCVPQLHRRSN
jgi:hypothetical protein